MKKALLLVLVLVLNLSALDLDTLPRYSTTYDKNSDPHKDLSQAVQKAKKHNKKILLVVGGDWCRWCGTLDNFLDDHSEVASSFYGSFEVVKVYYGKGVNKATVAFLKQLPPLKGTPHFYILDAKMKLLKSIDTSYLERGYGYNRKKVIHFIDQNK